MPDLLFFGDGPDAVFPCEKLEKFFPAKQAALGMAWGRVSSAQQHISFDHYPSEFTCNDFPFFTLCL